MGFVLTLLYIAMTLLSPAVLGDWAVNLHIMEILGALILLALLPEIPKARLVSSPETYLAIGLLFSVVLSIALTGWLGGAAQQFLGFSPILFTFFFVSITCRSVRRLKILTSVLMVVALFIFAQAAIAYYSGDFTSNYLLNERVEGAPLYRFRGLGIISDPNDLAQLFVMVIPLLWLRWKPRHFASNFLFTIVPAVILSIAIYFTHSRGGALGLIAVVLFGFKDKLGVIRSSILTAVLAAGLVILNVGGGRGMDQDDGNRVGLWSEGLTTFKTHPLFGVGVGRFEEFTDTDQTAHNSYVLCLAELGAFGYFFWMGMIVSGWSGLSRIIGSKAPKVPEIDTEQDNPDSPTNSQAALVNPWLTGAAMGRPAVAVQSNTMNFSDLSLSVSKPTERGGWFSANEESEENVSTNQSADEEGLAYAATILRVALVGLLVTSFFLSRTYAVAVYILLGMAFALKSLCRERLPDINLSVLSLTKRTGLVIIGSIAFLYFFVRFHGGH